MNPQSSPHPAHEIASLLFAIDPHFTLALERENHKPATIADLKNGTQLYIWPINAHGDLVCVCSVESDRAADDFQCETMPTAALYRSGTGTLILIWGFAAPLAASAESLGVWRQQSAPICPFDSKSFSGLDFDAGKDVGVGLCELTRIPMPSADWALVYLNACQQFTLEDLPRVFGNYAYGGAGDASRLHPPNNRAARSSTPTTKTAE